MELDTFKVVYITKTKEVEPVPHLWESNGILYWPPNKMEQRRQQSNPKSLPNLETWHKYKCEVKASGINLFAHASSTADIICAAESDEDGPQTLNSKRISKPPAKYYNLEEKASETSESDESSSGLLTQNDSQSSNSTTEYNESTRILDTTIIPVSSSPNKVTEETLTSTLTVIPESDISKLATTISLLETSVSKQFAELSIKLDKIEQIILHKTTVDVQFEKEFEDKHHIFPLDTVEKVCEFEKSLGDAEYKKKIIAHLRSIIGTAQPWKNASYRLCGIFFTKKLLTLYSWTGASRTGQPKEAFQKLNNILEIWFQVIKHADNNFTHNQKNEFFRDAVLKHSNTRLNPKRRVSKAQHISDTQESEHTDKSLEEELPKEKNNLTEPNSGTEDIIVDHSIK